ncbi:DUF916 domain-containing protein [Candidatus Kaiserbacteria bacterium]|nr:DUF916 domain-containing protein [Candidatus Kaiserbacteria bacterium]
MAQDQAGIGIKPALIEDVADPGSNLSYEITVSNLSNSTQTYYFLVKDIIGAEQNGAPIFAPDNIEKSGFEISEWIKLPMTEVEIEGGKNAVIPIEITVPQDASPGSHFGGIFLTLDPPKLRESGASVGYEVGNIVSIRIAGDVADSGTIRSFSTGNYVYGSLNIDFKAKIENSGNTLIRPYGPLEVKNMFGSRVATITFNESQSGVFPRQTRDFEIEWEGEGSGFGRYTAQLSLIYGLQGAQKTMSNSLSFWVLPVNIILPALGVLAVLLLIVFVSVKLYVRNQLKMVAGASRRRNVNRRNNSTSAFLLVIVAMLTVTALFLILLLVLFA